MDKKSYSQKKREKFPYREMYFKHNPGLFGCIWTCAYCHRPLLGRNNVVVDHIIPLNSPLGRNATFNLVASCSECNLRKSDKIDYRVPKGYVSKMLESTLFTIQRGIIFCFIGCWWILNAAWRGLIRVIQSVFRMIPFPMKMTVIAGICIILIISLK